MPLTPITVVYGTNGKWNPDGTACTGTITLQPPQDTVAADYSIASSPRRFQVVAGQIAAPNTFDTNGQSGLQAVVYEQIDGAKNPPPYVVNIPASGTLDLSTASRTPALSPPTPLFVPLSAVGAATNGVAPLDSTARVPAANSALVPQIQTLAYAATVTTDVSTGSMFRITLTGNLTLANPANGLDGQKALWQFVQDATGNRTLTLGSSFDLGPNTVTLSTGASKVDYMLAIYRAAATKWDILAFGAGY